jgi:hypothetical protein
MEEIRKKRDCGYVHSGIADWLPEASDARTRLDAFAEAAGFKGAGESWKEVQADGARKTLVDLLALDQAYRSRIMSEEDAESLAKRFLALWSEDEPRFFTNGSPADHWMPITSATFDCGVIALGKRRAGFLWFEDED